MLEWPLIGEHSLVKMEQTAGGENSNDKSAESNTQHNHKEKYVRLITSWVFLRIRRGNWINSLNYSKKYDDCFYSSLRSSESDKQGLPSQSLLPRADCSTARPAKEYIPRSGMKKYNNALGNLIPVRFQTQYVLWLNTFYLIIYI